jgi:hypothetical protein
MVIDQGTIDLFMLATDSEIDVVSSDSDPT